MNPGKITPALQIHFAGIAIEEPTVAKWWEENCAVLKALNTWPKFIVKVKECFNLEGWKVAAVMSFYRIRQGKKDFREFSRILSTYLRPNWKAVLLLLAWPLVAGLVSAVLLGIGTAMAQPALSAAVADHTHPSWRAQGLGVYRFWRDLGYAIGAVIAGLLAQALGLSAAVIAGGVLTLASGLLAARWITGGSSHVAAPRPAAALRC